MSKEREILQRFHAGTSQRNIALGLHVSRNTVAKVVAAYKSSNIPWEVIGNLDDDELHRRLYPEEVPTVSAQIGYSCSRKPCVRTGGNCLSGQRKPQIIYSRKLLSRP